MVQSGGSGAFAGMAGRLNAAGAPQPASLRVVRLLPWQPRAPGEGVPGGRKRKLRSHMAWGQKLAQCHFYHVLSVRAVTEPTQA